MSSGAGYRYWIPYLYNEICGKSIEATRSSIYPSAIVDMSGDLYTLNFYWFYDAQGPRFRFGKYSNGSSQNFKTWILWTDITSDFNCGTNPNNDGDYLKSIHTLFSPTIAQEILPTGKTSDKIYVFFRTPPLRWAGPAREGVEGVHLISINKSDFSKVGRKSYFWNSGANYFCAGNFPARTTKASCKIQPYGGFMQAAYDGNCIQMYHIAPPDDGHRVYYKIYDPSTLALKSGITNQGRYSDLTSTEIDSAMIYPRFQRVDSHSYFCCTWHGYGLSLGRFTNNVPSQKVWSGYCTWAETWDGGIAPYSRYQNDFCIIKNGNQLIACFLGLKAKTTSWNACDFSEQQGWSSSYISWTPSHLACILYSFPIANNTTAQNISGYNDMVLNTYPQNVIYNTTIGRGNRSAVSSDNTSASDDKRLYLNTQMFVPYTSNAGHTYIIYAYCYPGKTKQLYLGYAPYTITTDNHINLLSKTEFRDKDGNSFGSFTSCSRIITMDLKNNHLWITFMNADHGEYRYFHIKASDLVGE